jgi:hypothetical protein
MILLVSVVTFTELVHSKDTAPACQTQKCFDHLPIEVATKITACEITIATTECQSLGPNVKLRDCKTEAFCPNSLDQSYVAGCLIGAKDSVVSLITGVLTAPKRLFEFALDRTKFEVKYFSPNVYQSCKAAEDKIADLHSNTELDCEPTFWRAACPRTVVRNCKNRLLEDFPDIKNSYGASYQDVKYDKVLLDVRARLWKLAKARPSLVTFLQRHSAQSLGKLVGEALERQGYKFACMSSYDVSHFSCDAVIEAFTFITFGSTLLSKFSKVPKVADGMTTAESLAEVSAGVSKKAAKERASNDLVEKNLDVLRDFKAAFPKPLSEADTIQSLLEGKPTLLYHNMKRAEDFDLIRQNGFKAGYPPPIEVNGKVYNRLFTSSKTPANATDKEIVVNVKGTFFDCRKKDCIPPDHEDLISKGYTGIIQNTTSGITNSTTEVMIFDGTSQFRGPNIIRLRELVGPSR